MSQKLQSAIKIVEQTNKLLVKKFQTLGLDAIRMKKNEEIVTEVDMFANKFITSELLKHFPGDDIVSEEAKKIDNPGKNVWFIDPLDGTTNFSYGFRDFATCLAQTRGQKINLGVIGLPLAKEIYYVENGGPAYLNGKKIGVSTTFDHGSRYMVLLCGGHTKESQKKYLGIIKNLILSSFRFRVLASAGVEMTSVACGRADGCISTGIHPWDVLAGVLMVRAGGGKVTNFKGVDWTINDSTIVASNGLIHDQLLKLAQ